MTPDVFKRKLLAFAGETYWGVMLEFAKEYVTAVVDSGKPADYEEAFDQAEEFLAEMKRRMERDAV